MISLVPDQKKKRLHVSEIYFYIIITNDLKAEIHSICIYFTDYTYKNSVSFANSLIKMSHATCVDFILKITTTFFYFMPQF